jgi:type I restriction enzyme S subunit
VKAGWTEVALGDVAVITRKSVSPDTIPDGTPYVGLENIKTGGELHGVRSVMASELRSTKFSFAPTDVLFGKLRPYLAKIARPSFAGICSTDILPITPTPRIDAAYLTYYLRQPDVVSFASQRAAGANLPRLSPSELLRFRLPLPPLDEQRRIAQILDTVFAVASDAAHAAVQSAALGPAEFKKTARAQEVRDPATVRELVDNDRGGIRTGPFGSQLLHSEFVGAGVPVLGIDNVVTNEFRWSERRFVSPEKHAALKRYTVHPGDVLITIMGTCGRVAVVPSDIGLAINTKHLCCITLNQDRCLPEFLRMHFLHHPDAQSYLHARAKGAIMDGLNMGIIKDLPVVLPPIASQRALVRRLRVVDEARDRMILRSASLDRLGSALSERAFAGEL